MDRNIRGINRNYRSVNIKYLHFIAIRKNVLEFAYSTTLLVSACAQFIKYYSNNMAFKWNFNTGWLHEIFGPF